MIPHGHDALAQVLQVLGAGIIHIERMQPQGEPDIGFTLGQRLHRVPVAAEHGRHDDGAQARLTGRGDDGVAVCVELGRIQVTVGIDQHRPPPSDARVDQHAVAQRHAPVGTGSQIQVMGDDDHGCAQLTCQAM